MKLRVPWALRLLVSAAVLAALLLVVPVGQLWEAARGVPVGRWLACLALFLLGHVVGAWKWWGLLATHTRISFPQAIRAHFAGLMANLYLPGVAGGDLVRAGSLMRKPQGRVAIGLVSVIDRLLDCLALLLLSGLGVAWTAHRSDSINRALLVVTGVVLSVVLLGGLACLAVSRRGGSGIRGKFAEAIEVLIRHPALLLRSLLLSLLVQGAFVGLNAWLGAAAGVEASLQAWLVAWPLAKLVAALPVSLGGLGVREGALLILMRPFGGSAPAVAAAGLLWQALQAGGTLVGGLLCFALRTVGVVRGPEADEGETDSRRQPLVSRVAHTTNMGEGLAPKLSIVEDEPDHRGSGLRTHTG